jgi:hypothetical protein
MRPGATLLLSFLLGPVHGLTGASNTIWFSKPSAKWTDALPIGNGRLGAVVHGGYGMEQIGLNEDSIWSGGLQKRVNPKASAAFPGILDAFNHGNISEADSIWTHNLKGNGTAVRQYQPAGDLMIDFGHGNASVAAYNRSLDLTTSANQVSYLGNENGARYLREAVASYPHDVLGFRYTTNSSSGLDLKITLTRADGVIGLTVDAEKKTITMYGQGTNETSLKFVHQIRIVADTCQFPSLQRRPC